MANIEIGGFDDDDSLYLTTPARSALITTPGPMIYDRNGSLVWVGSAEFGETFDLNLQDYNGSSVLTVWNESTLAGHGAGTVKSSSYDAPGLDSLLHPVLDCR